MHCAETAGDATIVECLSLNSVTMHANLVFCMFCGIRFCMVFQSILQKNGLSVNAHTSSKLLQTRGHVLRISPGDPESRHVLRCQSSSAVVSGHGLGLWQKETWQIGEIGWGWLGKSYRKMAEVETTWHFGTLEKSLTMPMCACEPCNHDGCFKIQKWDPPNTPETPCEHIHS